MKKSTYISLASMLTVVLLSNFSNIKETRMLLTTLDDHPVLPSQLYDYSIPSQREVITADGVVKAIDDAKATLGRVLFYDQKLSSSENISCASCHDQSLSFTDRKQFSDGVNGLTARNSMHLNDLAWGFPGRFGWGMEHSSLEEMIKLPLNDENEIGINMEDITDKLYNTAYYPSLFQAAFQHPIATEEKIIEALTHFIYSMTTENIILPGRFDFPPSLNEDPGAILFANHCVSCHFDGSVYYQDPLMNQNGLDLDEGDIGAGVWDNFMKGRFKLTTLRNIALTAPYMHDGRFSSLEEVVEHYSKGIVNPSSYPTLPDGGLDFSKEEQEQLVGFLHTLTDNSFIENDKWADPFRNSEVTPIFRTVG